MHENGYLDDLKGKVACNNSDKTWEKTHFSRWNGERPTRVQRCWSIDYHELPRLSTLIGAIGGKPKSRMEALGRGRGTPLTRDGSNYRKKNEFWRNSNINSVEEPSNSFNASIEMQCEAFLGKPERFSEWKKSNRTPIPSIPIVPKPTQPVFEKVKEEWTPQKSLLPQQMPVDKAGGVLKNPGLCEQYRIYDSTSDSTDDDDSSLEEFKYEDSLTAKKFVSETDACSLPPSFRTLSHAGLGTMNQNFQQQMFKKSLTTAETVALTENNFPKLDSVKESERDNAYDEGMEESNTQLNWNMKDIAKALVTTGKNETKENMLKNTSFKLDDYSGKYEGCNIQIEGLSPDVTESVLKSYLEAFGLVYNVEMRRQASVATAVVCIAKSCCEWVISCLHEQPAPMGEIDRMLTVRYVD